MREGNQKALSSWSDLCCLAEPGLLWPRTSADGVVNLTMVAISVGWCWWWLVRRDIKSKGIRSCLESLSAQLKSLTKTRKQEKLKRCQRNFVRQRGRIVSFLRHNLLNLLSSLNICNQSFLSRAWRHKDDVSCHRHHQVCAWPPQGEESVSDPSLRGWDGFHSSMNDWEGRWLLRDGGCIGSTPQHGQQRSLILHIYGQQSWPV